MCIDSHFKDISIFKESQLILYSKQIEDKKIPIKQTICLIGIFSNKIKPTPF